MTDQTNPTTPAPATPPRSGAAAGSDALAANQVRVEQFRNEIDGLRLKGSNGSAERGLLVLGVLALIAGVVLAILGAVQVINAGDSPANQRAAMASGSMLGIVLVIAGAAIFLRYSLARYLRFWLVRLVYEGHADADRIVDAIDRASGGAEVSAPAPTVLPASAPPAPPPAAPQSLPPQQ